MANRYGQAARFAYNPEAVVRYFEEHAHLRADSFNDSTDGRTLRRWRSSKGITRHAFDRMEAKHDDLPPFVDWCVARGLSPVLRNRGR